MSGPDEGYPPPGRGDWTPPGASTPPTGGGPAAGTPPPQGPSAGPGPWPPGGPVRGAAHKPGAVPLRPLGLGDVYDAAFKIIRYNAKATVGAAALVAAAAMSVPVLVSLLVASFVDVDPGVLEQLGDPTSSSTVQPGELDSGQLTGLVAGIGALALGSFLQWIGLVLVTGMIAHVAMAAALGRTMGLGEAWAATRGRRGRLVGLVLVLAVIPVVAIGLYAGLFFAVAVTADSGLVVLFGLLTIPLLIVLLVLYWMRLQFLAVPALMLEGAGIRRSLGRAWQLSRAQFWRLFGIALLTGLITGIAGFVIGIPVSGLQAVLFATLESGQALLVVYVGCQALATVLSSAFVTPFSAGVTTLLYLDQRIRKEGFDVELLSAAGLPTGGAGGGRPGDPGAGATGPR